MKGRYILYTVISIFCLFSLAFGVYDQFFKVKEPKISKKTTPTNVIASENTVEEKGTIDTSEELKKEFNKMFKNRIELNGFNSQTIQKINDTREIVYTAVSQKQEKEDAYEINVNIPGINIQSDVANEFNITTQNLFVKKAQEIVNNLSSGARSNNRETSNNTVMYNEGSETIQNSNTNSSNSSISITIYNVDYMAFVNKNILSVVIRANLKEGNSSQRTIIQTYNYNLTSKQRVVFTDLLQSKNIEVTTAQNTIKSYIQERSDYDKQLSDTGNSPYSRNVQDRMYLPANTENFYLDAEENLYAIYAYGNDNETTEFDIIKIE